MMRRAHLVTAGLAVLLSACGTTVPLTSQGTVTGSNGLTGTTNQGLSPEAGPLATTGPSTSGTLSAPGAGPAGASRSGGGAGGADSGTAVGTTAVADYSRPATGAPVDVGIMYFKDLGAAGARFGGSGQDTTDQVGYMKSAVAWMNQHGGLGGHRINLVLYGAEIAGAKSYDQSLQEMCSMMTQDHHAVAAVIANITVTNNMATCMQKARGLYITDGGYFKTPSDWASLSYMASPSELDATVLGHRMAQTMLDKGAAGRGDTVGLVVYDAPGFHAAEQEFIKVANAAGITVVNYSVHYATSTPDLANSIAAIQSAELAMQSRNAKVVASLSSGGMMGFFLDDADQQKYYPRYLLSSNDNPAAAPAAAKPGQLKGALAVGYMPSMDVDLYAHPKLFTDETFAICRGINRHNPTVNTQTNLSISQRVCQALLLVQTAAKGYGGTTITGTTLRDGLRSLGSRISAGTTYRTFFSATKSWAPSAYRSMHFDEAANAFVYDAPPLPFT